MGIFARFSVLAAMAAATVAVAAATNDYVRPLRRRVITDSGAAAGDIQGAFDKFSALLGAPDNGNGPANRRGRRSIDWDADGVPFDMPGNFFAVNVTRGAVFKAKGGEFRVSNPPPVQHIEDNRFTSLNKQLALELLPFSRPRLFTPLKANVVDVYFEVPGKRGVRATSRGFGAVLLDVDRERLTSLTYFDRRGRQLAKVFAPARGGGLSFVGAVWNRAVVAKVRIVLGNARVTEWEGRHRDAVVLDDLVYGEPQRA